MAKGRKQYTIDADLIAAVEAAAKVRGVDPSTIVEDALKLLMFNAPAIVEMQRLTPDYAGVALECRNILRAAHDQIRVVANYVVDARVAAEAMASD